MKNLITILAIALSFNAISCEIDAFKTEIDGKVRLYTKEGKSISKTILDFAKTKNCKINILAMPGSLKSEIMTDRSQAKQKRLENALNKLSK